MSSSSSNENNTNSAGINRVGTWDPLPPRSESHRGRRRRRKETTEEEQKKNEDSGDGVNDDNNNNEKQQQQKPPAWLRKNTPGLNSYLKVVLDQDTLGHLHQLTARLREEIDTMVQERENNDNKNSSGEATKANESDSKEQQQPVIDKNNNKSSSKKKRQLRLKPRSLPSLHMTFFFGGEVLCELPVEELKGWHEKLTKRFRQSGFVLMNDDENVVDKPGDSVVVPMKVDEDDTTNAKDNLPKKDDINDFTFELKELAVFPPRRNNLIVAILEAAPAWHELYRDIRNIALQQQQTLQESNGGNAASVDDTTTTFHSEGLAEIAKRAGKEKWIAHITLGNLFGGTKADTKALIPLCKDFSKRHLSNDDNNNSKRLLKVEKITMGGPIPQQMELDWDFIFR